jgi:hypothetical protein
LSIPKHSVWKHRIASAIINEQKTEIDNTGNQETT